MMGGWDPIGLRGFLECLKGQRAVQYGYAY